MIFQKLPAIEGEPQIYARIDDDGLCRLTCSENYPELQEWIADGNTPLDPANTDYQNIMKLVEEGQLVIQPAD